MIHFEKGTVAWRLVEVISVCGEDPYRSLCILGNERELRGRVKQMSEPQNKVVLSIREAAAYSSIGINTIERLLKEPGESVCFICRDKTPCGSVSRLKSF